MYADDMVMYVPGKTAMSVSTHVSQPLQSIVSLRCPSRDPSLSEANKLNLKINKQCVEQDSEVKYLDLMLESPLKF